MGRRVPSRVRAYVACLCLVVSAASDAAAQSERNWHVLSNGMDAMYIGLGAGGDQEPGRDGIGTWIDGNDLRGNSKTALGNFGYKQASFFESVCVMGGGPLEIDFPALLWVEFTGRNNNDQDVFVRPSCAVGGLPIGADPVTGVLPYSVPPGASVNFMIGTAVVPCNPIGADFLLPNNGLVPASLGGNAEVIAAACATLAIPSADECWIVEFTWLPSVVTSKDHVDGWWHWATTSGNGNQYWAMSTDELNTYTSNTVATDADITQLQTFFSNMEYDFYATSTEPVIHEVLAPVGANASGVYYSTPSFGPMGPGNPNGGGDIGRHGGVSLTGAGGTLGSSGLPNQTPGSAVPTIGFMLWDNAPVGGSPGGIHVVWVQIDWGGVLGLPPTSGLLVDIPAGPPSQRLPISCYTPVIWPQVITLTFLPTFLIDSSVAKPDLDPTGEPPGSYGIDGYWGASVQLPISSLDPVCAIGLPLAIDYGATGVKPDLSDLEFDPTKATISVSGSVVILD